IVAPMSREARAIPGDVFVCGSGAGAPDRVVAAAEASTAEVVIIAGVCAGLDPSLGPGSLILGRRLVAGGEPELTPSHALLAASRMARRARRTRDRAPHVAHARIVAIAGPSRAPDARRDADAAAVGAAGCGGALGVHGRRGDAARCAGGAVHISAVGASLYRE